MEDLDAEIPLEVPGIERHNAGNPVNVHRGDKARVMYLEPGHFVDGYQTFPFRENLGSFGREPEERFAPANTLPSLRKPQTEAVTSTGRVQTFQNSIRFCGQTHNEPSRR